MSNLETLKRNCQSRIRFLNMDIDELEERESCSYALAEEAVMKAKIEQLREVIKWIKGMDDSL